MRRRTFKNTFAGGELADALEGRTDITRYPISVQKASNFYITRFGAASNRPGMQFIDKSKGVPSEAIRLIPFEFSVTQTYILEFTNNIMRVFKDGGIVLDSKRTAAYQWTESLITPGEYYLELAGGGDAFPGNGQDVTVCYEDGLPIPLGTVSSLAAGEWAFGNDGSLPYTTLFVRTAGTTDPDSEALNYIETDYQLATGVLAASLDEMTFTQSADLLFLAGSFYPRKIVRLADDLWTSDAISFAPNSTTPIDTSVVTTGFTANDRQVLYKFSRLDDDGVESLPTEELTVDIDLNWPEAGRVDLSLNSIRSTTFQWTLSTGGGTTEYYLELAGGGDPSISEPSQVFGGKVELTNGTAGALVAGESDYDDVDSLGFNTVYVRLSDNSDPDTQAVGYVTYLLETDVQFRVYKNYRGDWGWIGDVSNPWFLDDNIEPLVNVAPKEDKTPFDSTDSDTFPYAVGLFEQRLCYARTDGKPQTIFSSTTGDLTNYTISRPLSAEDSIEATLYSGGRVDEIRHLVALDKLIVLTTGSEWTFDSGPNSDALTPFSVYYRNQGYAGCSTSIQPLTIDNQCLFVQRNGKDVRNMQFKVEDDNYLGDVLTYFVPHLFEGKTIVDWCYQQHPHNLIWFVLSDGTLLTMTYIPEQQMVAVTRHKTAGEVRACASITTQGDDEVYLSVERVVNGKETRYMERLASRDFGEKVRDGEFLDSSLSYKPENDIVSIVITPSNVLVSSPGHGYVAGDFILLDDVEGVTSTGSNAEYSTFNNKYYMVVGETANTYFLADLEGTWLTSADFTGTPVDGTGVTYKTTNTVSGLGHLESETVSVLADGQAIGLFTVTNGAITLGTSDPGYGVIHVGLPYVCDLETLRLETLAGGDDSIQGLQKRLMKVKTRFKDSSGGWMGPDEDNLTLIKWRQDEEWLQADSLLTGDIDHALEGGSTSEGRILFRQPDPLPSTVLMYMIDYDVGTR